MYIVYINTYKISGYTYIFNQIQLTAYKLQPLSTQTKLQEIQGTNPIAGDLVGNSPVPYHVTLYPKLFIKGLTQMIPEKVSNRKRMMIMEVSIVPVMKEAARTKVVHHVRPLKSLLIYRSIDQLIIITEEDFHQTMNV